MKPLLLSLKKRLIIILVFGGVIGGFFLFQRLYDPIPLGSITARDGHRYSVGGVTHVCAWFVFGCSQFEVDYDCEGACDKEQMRHNARDILEFARERLNRRHYQHLLVSTSRAPHDRGKVDSEIVFLSQPDGSWTTSKEWFK